MDEKINEDLRSIKFIYTRNKPFILPGIIILACIFLFFQFTIPQFNSLLEARQEANEASARLQILKENLNVLTNTDENLVDFQLEILNSALPLGKDFAGILNAINYASLKTGVALGSFSFQLGDLSKSERSGQFPMVNVVVPVNGDATAISSFVGALSNSMPLSEISFIKVGGVSSTINLSFYYMPLESSGNSDKVNPISQKGLLLINKLKSFGDTSSNPIFSPQAPIATPSSQEIGS